MKKTMVWILLTGFFVQGWAQVVINPKLPPGGLVMKSQLWGIVLLNTTNQDMRVQVQFILTDKGNNQRILSGTSRLIDLQKGVTQITATEVAPVLYNVLNAGYSIDASPEGFLPVGVFEVCYSVLAPLETVNQILAEECETVEIEPLSPPQLVSPADSEAVEITRPLFEWLPPEPYQLFNNLTYDFSLVEVQSLQTSAEALQQNIPLHNQQNLLVNNLQYPVALPELDTAKIYAWRITARSAGNPVAESETWTFTVKKRNAVNHSQYHMNYYAKVKAVDAGSYIVCDGDLKFQYQNEYNDKSIGLKVVDIGTAKRHELRLDSATLNMHYGQNLVELDLSGAKGLTDKHIYLLELVNSKNEHWYLKFAYRRSK